MRFPISLVLLTLGGATVWGQAKAVPAKAPEGYLSAAQMPDLRRIVPPPPAAGDPREARDRAIYRATRAYQGTPRWALALSDNDISPAGILKAFSCSLGVTLTEANAPRLTALLTRADVDWTTAYNMLKSAYTTKRPYDIEPAPICLPDTSRLANSPDYVSGHSTFGWAVGLVLAELAPDAATSVISRGRAYAESRAVCGVHHASAVEGGMATGTVVLAAQHGSAAFRADMNAARTELARLRAAAKQKPASCALENEALTKSPY